MASHQFRVQLWQDEWYPEPDSEEIVEASAPHLAVVKLCQREGIQQASWVQVDELSGDSWLSLRYLDITVSPTGDFTCEAVYC